MKIRRGSLHELLHVPSTGAAPGCWSGMVGEKGLHGEGIVHGGDGTNALPGPLNEGWSCQLVGRKLTIGPFCKRT